MVDEHAADGEDRADVEVGPCLDLPKQHEEKLELMTWAWDTAKNVMKKLRYSNRTITVAAMVNEGVHEGLLEVD